MALARRLELRTALFLLGLALIFSGTHAARGGHVLNRATVFDITTFGAKPDGQTESAQALIQAWNAACKSQGATVVLIPRGTFLTGEVFFYGPCTANHVTIEVQGTVLAQPDLSEFANGQWITIRNVNGLTIQGTGTFNGQGEKSWQYDSCGRDPICASPLPPSLVFEGVSNSILQGVTLLNSKGKNVKISNSNHITIQNVNISAPLNSPNTDGVVITTSNAITVARSIIATGNECVNKGEGAIDIVLSALKC